MFVMQERAALRAYGGAVFRIFFELIRALSVAVFVSGQQCL
jgi:hypothetical protein